MKKHYNQNSEKRKLRALKNKHLVPAAGGTAKDSDDDDNTGVAGDPESAGETNHATTDEAIEPEGAPETSDTLVAADEQPAPKRQRPEEADLGEELADLKTTMKADQKNTATLTSQATTYQAQLANHQALIKESQKSFAECAKQPLTLVAEERARKDAHKKLTRSS